MKWREGVFSGLQEEVTRCATDGREELLRSRDFADRHGRRSTGHQGRVKLDVAVTETPPGRPVRTAPAIPPSVRGAGTRSWRALPTEELARTLLLLLQRGQSAKKGVHPAGASSLFGAEPPRSS